MHPSSNIKVTRSGHIVDVHTVHIKLTSGEQITGIVNIAENNCKRLSELFTKDNSEFIVVSKCNTTHRTLFVNKRNIVWAAPDLPK